MQEGSWLCMATAVRPTCVGVGYEAMHRGKGRGTGTGTCTGKGGGIGTQTRYTGGVVVMHRYTNEICRRGHGYA